MLLFVFFEGYYSNRFWIADALLSADKWDENMEGRRNHEHLRKQSYKSG